MVTSDFLAFLRTPPRIEIGHVLDVLARLPERSVHCCVTSPPYFGLRKYPAPPVVWGGDAGCRHRWVEERGSSRRGSRSDEVEVVGSSDGAVGRGPRSPTPVHATCAKCSAWCGCLGNEPKPAMYVAHLVECFRAVRRVLRDDGTLWLNLGDSYGGGPPRGASYVRDGVKRKDRSAFAAGAVKKAGTGLKPLDLVGIPWAVAEALRADGWYLRSDVIWHNLNAMPESQQGWRWARCRKKKRNLRGQSTKPNPDRGDGGHKDVGGFPYAEWEQCSGCPTCAKTDGLVLRRGAWRPTGAHEYVFLLAKTPDYFADGEAVKTPVEFGVGSGNRVRKFGEAVGLPPGGLGRSIPWVSDGPGANLRDVWVFPTEPLKDAHFAAFPRRLPELCIKAGTSERGCCPACGAPWARVVEDAGRVQAHWVGTEQVKAKAAKGRHGASPVIETGSYGVKKLVGWRSTCACPPHEPVLCVVLDPFAGSGTTLRVAEDLGRLWLGVDLSDEYLKLMRKRTAQRTVFGAAGRNAVEKSLAGKSPVPVIGK